MTYVTRLDVTVTRASYGRYHVTFSNADSKGKIYNRIYENVSPYSLNRVLQWAHDNVKVESMQGDYSTVFLVPDNEKVKRQMKSLTKHYVTMTDKFMSGWGDTKGKTNKLIFECDTYDDAMTVIRNAELRSDMNYINYRGTKKPYYNPSRYYVQIKNKDVYPKWYNPTAVW